MAYQEPAKRVRWGRVLLAAAVGIALLFVGIELWVRGYHHFRVWRADGVYCFPLNEADGNYFLYGDDCP